MNKQEFKDAVKHEATVLRSVLTETEKERLDFDSLEPKNPVRCIYGLVTGNCASARAHELIEAACTKIVDNDSISAYPSLNELIDSTEESCDINKLFYGPTVRDFTYLSAIEAYIMTTNNNNEDLLKYIKGEIAEVVL